MDIGSATGQALIEKAESQRSRGHPRKKVCYLFGKTSHFCKDCPKNHYQKFSESKQHKSKPACTESVESHSDMEYDPDEGVISANQLRGVDSRFRCFKSHDTHERALSRLRNSTTLKKCV